ncbi:hypothetical protein [Thalassotalea agarivorans]|uniref:Uncharacterized protein n=1 Tax=Thalassotalea agarivorans TaxID=349064 RepID=A0A1I0D803_THASX|nr:hypothetical protein [Thalassotalea agarivorans]SET28368.1 hypothetical protein SAMN05660429_01411 [Thalassotalea agarivorans]
MAIFSIMLGSIFFVIAIVWFTFVALFSDPNNAGVGFGFILGILPAILSLLLTIPSTVIRSIHVIKHKPQQTVKEKAILCIGLLISVAYCCAFIKLSFA